MKYVTLCFLLTLFALRGMSQRSGTSGSGPSTTKADSFGQRVIRAKCKTTYVQLPWLRQVADSTWPFRDIRVIDYRWDTARIGLVAAGESSEDQVVFRKASAAGALAAWLDSAYTQPKGAYTMLVVIKDLWISDSVDYAQTEEMRHNTYYKVTRWNLAFRLEAYLRAGEGYIPLTYMDTTLTSGGGLVWVMAQHRIPQLTGMFMEKVSAMDFSRSLARRRPVPMAMIDSFCMARFDYPMDTAVRLMKGVYASAEEFRNNQPSIGDFEITNDKQGNLELRIRDKDGQYNYTHTLWGFCDSNRVFVMMDGNCFPVFKVHHQWYVLGSNEYRTASGVMIPFALPLGPYAFVWGIVSANETVYRKLRLFRLDTESGRVMF
jgi:hypothetical protein